MDVTLNTNKTEPFTQLNQDANYAELLNNIKFSLPVINNFIAKSPTNTNYFYGEQRELNDTLLYEVQQQDPVIRQLFLWKRYVNYPSTP